MRKKYNPKTNRFDNVQAPIPSDVNMDEYWDNARAETDRKAMTRTTGPVREGKDSPLYRTPTQMTLQASQSDTPTSDPATDFDIAEYINSRYGDDPMAREVMGWLLNGGSSGGSGGSGGPSRADRERAARTVKQAGRQAKKDYTRLAQEGFDRRMGEADQYYTGRETTARGQIDDATRDFLQNLIAPTAYKDTPMPNMRVQEQGLGESLGAYGATGDLARQQMASSQGDLDFASQLAARGMGQLNTAQSNYFDAIRNAGLGAQTAARTGLTQNLESMRGMTRAQADAVRQQLLQQGIEALISGNQSAANAYL
jgi:hypothetical protein